jgi:hypothetical protein
MQQFDEVEGRSAARRLRCVQQITEADEETLQIVSAVLERTLPVSKPERKKRGRPAHLETEKGGGA